MPTRTVNSRARKKRNMSYCKCSGVNKTKGFTCKQHCKYGRPKKSRKPKKKSRKPKKKSRRPKKKSRKPAKKKSRKPKKKSRKSKSKFKIGKDRVPSLFELAAQKLPHTRDWSDDSNQHLKSLVMKPQQKGLKKIMGSELIQNVSSRVEPVGDIEPLSENEIDILMGEAFRLDDERPSEDEVNLVYSTLKNLREIPEDDGHYSRPEFFQSYADRLRDAKEKYMRKLRDNLQEVKDDIQYVKDERAAKMWELDEAAGEWKQAGDDEPFDFERDYTFEDDKGNMLTGSAAARTERQFLDQLALDAYKDRLAVAESYRNDLYNYAHSLVQNFVTYDDNWWLMDDFGENNELYHQYRP